MNKTVRTQNTVELVFNVLVVCIMTLVFYFSFFAFFGDQIRYFLKGYVLTCLLYSLFLTIFLVVTGGFHFCFGKISDICISGVIAVIGTNIISYFESSLIANGLLNVLEMFEVLMIQIITIIILDYLFWRIFHTIFKPSSTLLIWQHEYENAYEKLSQKGDLNFKIEKLLQLDDDLSIAYQELPNYDYVLLVNVDNKYKKSIVNKAYSMSKSIYEIPNTHEIIVNNAKCFHLIDTPLLFLGQFGPSQIERIIKRFFDVFISFFGLILLLPIIIVCAIAIKINDRGPVFYYQTRLTQYGKVFRIIKFRSMKTDAESNGIAQFAKENDDRITSVGKVLRKFRLDELPQLVNILKGEMSIVGPRPERPEIANEIYKEFPEFEYRLKVKAGLTGYAQVYGKYNTKLKDKLLLDLMYIENFSIVLDVRIMIMTIKILFSKESTEGVSK